MPVRSIAISMCWELSTLNHQYKDDFQVWFVAWHLSQSGLVWHCSPSSAKYKLPSNPFVVCTKPVQNPKWQLPQCLCHSRKIIAQVVCNCSSPRNQTFGRHPAWKSGYECTLFLSGMSDFFVEVIDIIHVQMFGVQKLPWLLYYQLQKGNIWRSSQFMTTRLVQIIRELTGPTSMFAYTGSCYDIRGARNNCGFAMVERFSVLW